MSDPTKGYDDRLNAVYASLNTTDRRFGEALKLAPAAHRQLLISLRGAVKSTREAIDNLPE